MVTFQRAIREISESFLQKQIGGAPISIIFQGNQKGCFCFHQCHQLKGDTLDTLPIKTITNLDAFPFRQERKLGADPNESKRGAITHVCGGSRAGKPGLQSIVWAQRRHVHGTLQLNIEGIRQVWQGGRFKGPGTSQDITKPRRASDARSTHNFLPSDGQPASGCGQH